MTIRTARGQLFQARLETDANGVLWLIDAEQARYQLAVILQGGWRIVDTTAAERALLEAHAFGSGRVQ